MKTRINKPQSTLALATLLAWAALCLTACINQGFDPDDNSPHAHLTLLQLGTVTIADAQTATDATTRAATGQDVAGFIGIRKSAFAPKDVITLTPVGGDAGAPVNATLSSDGSAWTLAERTFTAEGISIIASYTPTTNTAGLTHLDVLESIATTPPVDGSKTAFTLKHANAMIEITPPVGKTVSDVKVNATPTSGSTPGTPESLATVEETIVVSSKDAPIYRTIAKPGTVESITLTIDGTAYTATLATPLSVQANKRYPIALSLKVYELIATVGTATMGWGAGTDINLSYTRLIGSAEDLAQFAHDVNNEQNNAPTAVVLQTADIDLSQLKTKEEANQAAGTNKYTYEATKDQWVPIGYTYSNSAGFKGTYNGNGYTISGLKMTDAYTYTEPNSGKTRGHLGLFGFAHDATLTGIHIRGCQLSCDNTSLTSIVGGPLVAVSGFLNVSLCSATGSISVKGAHEVIVAGLIASSVTNVFSRCNTSVDVTMEATSADPDVNGVCAGFTNSDYDITLVACSASGTVTRKGTTGDICGFIHVNTDASINVCSAYFCQFTGTIVGAPANEKAVFGPMLNVVGCYATGDYDTFASAVRDVTNVRQNNALTGTLTNAFAGVTAGVAEGNVYAALAAGSYTTPADALIKTLHWSETEGYTLTPVERRWKASEAWKKDPNGGLPTLNLFYEGETAAAP